MNATDLVELAQLTVVAAAVGASVLAFLTYLRTWHHIVLLDTEVDRKLRIAAFAAVGREALRVLHSGFLWITVAVSFWALPDPPPNMPYHDWLLVRKGGFLCAALLLLMMIVWDFWLRDTQRKAKARYP